jgi:hypothetical protein
MVLFTYYPEHNLSHLSMPTTLHLCFLSKTFRWAICLPSSLFSNTACTLLGICVSHQRHYHDGDSLARNPKWETTSKPTGRLLLCWCRYEISEGSNLMFSSVYSEVSVTHPTSSHKEIDHSPPTQPITHTHFANYITISLTFLLTVLQLVQCASCCARLSNQSRKSTA